MAVGNFDRCFGCLKSTKASTLCAVPLIMK